jgi:hypothetical protein
MQSPDKISPERHEKVGGDSTIAQRLAIRPEEKMTHRSLEALQTA